jgi:hypothetical protein
VADLPRLPNNSQRIAVIGRTGSGKTQAAVWNLSRRNFLRMPWVVFNFKGDELIDSIPYADHVDVGTMPTRPGIYVVHPLPNQREEMTAYLWALWNRQNVGLFCDEGYMMGDDDAFLACLTQGRSRRIPMIVLTQRPAWISRFVFTESQFYQIFSLSDRRDLKTVAQFIPGDELETATLPEFHSWYYDVGRNKLWQLAPVPQEDEILAEIRKKFEAHFESQKVRVKKI